LVYSSPRAHSGAHKQGSGATLHRRKLVEAVRAPYLNNPPPSLVKKGLVMLNDKVESKRYLVFSNERGTRAARVRFEFPTDTNKEGDSETPDNFLRPIGIAYEHSEDVYGDGLKRNLVGYWLLSDAGMSNLVGKMLTIIDAMFTDPTQRKAFKDLVTQELWGFQRDKEEMVRQTYQSIR
jgi:hypothetical protein